MIVRLPQIGQLLTFTANAFNIGYGCSPSYKRPILHLGLPATLVHSLRTCSPATNRFSRSSHQLRGIRGSDCRRTAGLKFRSSVMVFAPVETKLVRSAPDTRQLAPTVTTSLALLTAAAAVGHLEDSLGVIDGARPYSAAGGLESRPKTRVLWQGGIG